MMRVSRVERVLTNAVSFARVRQARLTTDAIATDAAASRSFPLQAFKEVKFVKEDVHQVMTELPDYEFYEMNESVPNPYQGTTLDRSILLDPPTPAWKRERAQFSKLENGLKIGSVDRGGLKAEIGLFVDVGSRFETSANFGVCNMVSSMAFKSTAHLSNLRTVKTLEQLGANSSSSCRVTPEETVYQVGVMREYVPLVVPLLVGNVLFPRLLPWEVKASHAQVRDANASVSIDETVREMLRNAAYCNSTLGLRTRATERSMADFTPETIRSFMIDHFAPERMAIVGVNVKHEELCKWAMRSFVDYNAISLKQRETVKAAYVGGEVRRDAATPFCHLALGFESVPFGSKDIASIAILQTLLGGGSAVSSGIGGCHLSRLAKQVVSQNPHVESCSSFNQLFSDSGLFGVYGVCHPEKANEMATSMIKVLKSLPEVSSDELAIAKSFLKGRILRELDSDAILMQDMGYQLIRNGCYASPADFTKLIDSVSVDQVVNTARQILSSKPSLAAFGDTHTVPNYAAVEAALRT